MRVLVTGATGFTGRYVVEALHARGHETHSLTADLTDWPSLADEIAECRPGAAIHLAAKAFVNTDDFSTFYSVNQLGSFALCDALSAVVPGIPVLLASTAQVYGPNAAGLLDETQPVSPSNHYGLSKLAMELGTRLWADRLRLIITRPFNYTGVGQEERYLVAKIVAHFRRRAQFIELGNLHVARDIGDVRSVADAFCALISNIHAPALLNVSSGHLSTIRDIIDHLEELTGHIMDVRVNPALVRTNDVPTLGGDNGLLRRTLPNWQTIPLKDTLSWMLNADEPTQ